MKDRSSSLQAFGERVLPPFVEIARHFDRLELVAASEHALALPRYELELDGIADLWRSHVARWNDRDVRSARSAAKRNLAETRNFVEFSTGPCADRYTRGENGVTLGAIYNVDCE